MGKKKDKKKLSAYNLHVQREMKAGKSMTQAAASWNGGSKSKSSKPKKQTRGGSKVAKNKPRHRRGGFNTQKLFKLVRLGALALPAANIAMLPVSNAQKIEYLSKAYFGFNTYNGTLALNKLVEGWGPFLVANLVTYGIPKVSGILRGI